LRSAPMQQTYAYLGMQSAGWAEIGAAGASFQGLGSLGLMGATLGSSGVLSNSVLSIVGVGLLGGATAVYIASDGRPGDLLGDQGDDFWANKIIAGLAKFRNGPPSSLSERYAWEEALQNGQQVMLGQTMKDDALQQVRPGDWIKMQSRVSYVDRLGFSVDKIIHWSQHVRTGEKWDIKYK